MPLKRKKGWLGVDEAGRGAIAGPLIAGAVLLPPGFVGKGIRDSKRLSPSKRETFSEYIKEKCIWSLGIVSVEELQELSLSDATFLAMTRAINDIESSYKGVLLDGNCLIPDFTSPQDCVIGGDDKYLQIAAASILAKVARDEIMVEYGKTYPEYEFEQHKGYPTKNHSRRLKKYGPSPIHRLNTGPLKRLWES